MAKTKLTTEERCFFEKVRLAVFANPFSDERAAVDRQLVKKRPPSNRKKLVDLLIKVVDKQLRQICPVTNSSILNFREDDRQLLQYGILFHLFHKYSADFDQHIQEQIKQGDKPCPVDFAADLLAEIVAIGIGKKESVRFVSLFFQMRRAFYFIDQIVGSSPCMKDLRRDLWNNIFTHDIWMYDQYLCDRMEDFSTMLLGQPVPAKDWRQQQSVDPVISSLMKRKTALLKALPEYLSQSTFPCILSNCLNPNCLVTKKVLLPAQSRDMTEFFHSAPHLGLSFWMK